MVKVARALVKMDFQEHCVRLGLVALARAKMAFARKRVQPIRVNVTPTGPVPSAIYLTPLPHALVIHVCRELALILTTTRIAVRAVSTGPGQIAMFTIHPLLAIPTRVFMAPVLMTEQSILVPVNNCG